MEGPIASERIPAEQDRGSRSWLRFSGDERLVALVRRGDVGAFEALYDRHVRELLSFCRYMLGSRQDAEDAVQSTFASAYRALLADERPIAVRAWLFVIARNACLSILRRRPVEEAELGSRREGEDPLAQVQRREDLRHLLRNLLELPERQRAALVLAELHGFNHGEIATLLGVRAEQVKSYVYQARCSLISEHLARGADCHEIRAELSGARGAALLRGHLRRHLRACAGCRDYAQQLSRRRGQLGALLPVAPSLSLKRRALHSALGKGPASGASAGGAGAGGAGLSLAGTTAELAGGGAKALVAKLLAGIACLGAGTGAGAIMLGVAPAAPGPATAKHRPHLAARSAALLLSTTGAAAAGAALPGGQAVSPHAGDRPAGLTGRPASAGTPEARAAAAGERQGVSLGTGGGAPGKGESEHHGGGSPGHSQGGPESHGKEGSGGHGAGGPPNGGGPAGHSHGNSGHGHGHPGGSPGNSGHSHGRSGGPSPGNSANSPAHSGAGPSNSANGPGHSGAGPGSGPGSTGHSGASPGSGAAGPGHAAGGAGGGNGAGTATGNGNGNGHGNVPGAGGGEPAGGGTANGHGAGEAPGAGGSPGRGEKGEQTPPPGAGGGKAHGH